MSETSVPACTVERQSAQGMITLRADLSAPELKTALKATLGLGLPDQGGFVSAGPRSLLWMSPDELMVLCPAEDSGELTAALSAALSHAPGLHHLVTDVSDARATFALTGDWRGVVARLCPADLRSCDSGRVRRSRFAQVPAALVVTDETAAMVLCFRSVGDYMADLLNNAAGSV